MREHLERLKSGAISKGLVGLGLQNLAVSSQKWITQRIGTIRWVISIANAVDRDGNWHDASPLGLIQICGKPVGEIET
jgi:hypothetical protein